MVFYADQHKILCALLICNKKPRSFVRNGVFASQSIFPPAWLYGMEPFQRPFIYWDCYHDSHSKSTIYILENSQSNSYMKEWSSPIIRKKLPSKFAGFNPLSLKTQQPNGFFPQPFANHTTYSRTGQKFLPSLPEDCFLSPTATRKSPPGVAGSSPGQGWWDRWPCSRHPGRYKRQSSSSRPGEYPAPSI